MNDRPTEAAVVSILARIAPEAEASGIDPDQNLRDQLDLDSMDFLNFIAALAGEYKIAVPEADYGQLATLRGCVGYLVARIGNG